MRFRIKCCNKGNQDKWWWEDYEKDIDDPDSWGKAIVNYYNSTLKPMEKEREYLGFEILGDVKSEEFHDWVKRTDGMSVMFRGKVTDLVYCRKCGITGKRFGLRETVKIDSAFAKKAYQKCNLAQKEMQKKGEE